MFVLIQFQNGVMYICRFLSSDWFWNAESCWGQQRIGCVAGAKTLEDRQQKRPDISDKIIHYDAKHTQCIGNELE